MSLPQARRSLMPMEALLDQLPVGVIVVDDAGIIQRFNRYEEQLSGLSREKTIGRSFFSEVAPCTKDIALGQRFREGLAAGDLNLEIEFSFPYPYNRVARDVWIRAMSLEGDARGLHVVLIDDISSRKSLERHNQSMMSGLRAMLSAQHGGGDVLRPDEGRQAQVFEEAYVLFADLSSFVRVAPNIPPTELFARLDRRVRAATDAIMRHNGRIDQVSADGVLAIFHRDGEGDQGLYDVLRAARDTLRSGDAADRRIPFRVGLALGNVVVGQIGQAEFGRSAAVGAAVNIARRIVEVGRPNEILISSAVAERARDVIHADELIGVTPPGAGDAGSVHRLVNVQLP